MNPGRAFVAGVVGTLIMSALMIWVRFMGVPLHIEWQLAGWFGSQAWLVGLIVYLVIGGLLGLAYAVVFEYVLSQAGVGPGLMLGAWNTIFAGFLWGAFSNGPGHFWEHFGAPGIATLFLVHFVFGGVVGSLYKTKHGPAVI